MKIGVTKVLSVVGLVASLIGTVVSSVASDRKTNETIARLVDEKLNGK